MSSWKNFLCLCLSLSVSMSLSLSLTHTLKSYDQFETERFPLGSEISAEIGQIVNILYNFFIIFGV